MWHRMVKIIKKGKNVTQVVFFLVFIIYLKIWRFGQETFNWKVRIVSVNGNKVKTKLAGVNADKKKRRDARYDN